MQKGVITFERLNELVIWLSVQSGVEYSEIKVVFISENELQLIASRDSDSKCVLTVRPSGIEYLTKCFVTI